MNSFTVILRVAKQGAIKKKNKQNKFNKNKITEDIVVIL